MNVKPAAAMGELCNDDRLGTSMIEPLLCGIVLGLIPVTLLGLFVAAWNQYRRGSSALGG
jgi:cytochrome b6-f complex subunit 5